MYFIIQLSIYVGFTVVQRLPENDEDRSKHGGVMKNRI